MKNQFNNFLKLSDGEQIFYTTNFKPGDVTKNVLVFNYGLVCSNHHWKYQVEHFDKLGHHILLHDYRGHFQSSGGQNLENITFRQIAFDLKELIDHLELTDSIFFGHSMGVNVCLEYCKHFDHDIASQILISGTMLPVHNIMMNTHLTGPLKPILNKVREKFPDYFNAFWKYGGWTPLIQKAIHKGGFHLEMVSEEFIEVYLMKIAQLGPELFFQLIDQMQEHDILAFIEQIKTRTLVVGGNHDKVIPNFLQRMMQEKLPNSELYVIHEGSHVPQADFPEMINERIELFLS
ncbi:MAG: alpha/beta hydrolase [Bdellovibrionota bacterium]|nr:alpha/beta hydrolase [Bdellovibrionota bacterium]